MPLRQVVKSHRHFAGDTLHSHIGTQPPQHLDHQREILLGGTQAEAAGLGVVLRGKGRSPNELQLVELDRFERPRRTARNVSSQVDSTPYSTAT